MLYQGWNNLETAQYWLFLGSDFALIALAWQQLRKQWKSEQSRRSALAAMSLLTALILFSFYVHYAPSVFPRKTTNHFMIMLKIVAGLGDEIGSLLSVGALVTSIIWRRSSKHLASGLALGAGIWMCLWWTMAAMSSILND